MSNRGRRVVVAMSGGVDSSMAAAVLKKEGWEVIGATMRLWTEEDSNMPSGHRRCCSAEEAEDARRVCQILDIPFYVLNFEPQFRKYVVDYFCEEYLRGRTPNPCIACNKRIKFDLLLNKAVALGADYLATGHYARIEVRGGRYVLLKAIDAAKDQSYVLYSLGQSELQHLLFPLGSFNKKQIRGLAREMGLPVWDKEESQEICFITNGDYHEFLARRGLNRPGDIVNGEGKLLGRHSGIGFYTVGQRRGLGLASRKPLYVLAIDPVDSKVVVGSNEQLLRRELYAEEVSYISGDPPPQTAAVTAKIRYKSPE
ncbi:MAG: tRNA 2-thiouridine(34) synthase MnmA, partial [Chloroflexi bacterium]|nr:tRNA 2-thiouridine(34) synthase MnmA [Chloroflexota bacterium]